MNCISGRQTRALPFTLLRENYWVLLVGLFIVAACGIGTSESAATPLKREYDAHYLLRVDPAASAVDISLEIRQPRDFLRELRFSYAPDRIDAVEADGTVAIDDGTLTWQVPERGGTLSWRVQINHQRGRNTYDAWLGPNWGIFRAEDAIPRASTRVLKGSTSATTFAFDLPDKWSAVTEYTSTQDPIRIERADRRFDQPTGWILVGDVGVRRETIAGIRVAIAGPQGHAVRRLDMLALLNWVLPELAELLPDPPGRLTVISAGEPMWRGGLSAPASFFIHADRPMISENGTSPLMHEVMHAALPIRADESSDWIVEGLAEYYGLELLRRGNAISARRHRIALEDQADWATKASTLCGQSSTGPTTALAVMTLHALNQEILEKTSGNRNLDDLVRLLVERGPSVDFEKLAGAAAEIMGDRSDVLHSDALSGCPRMSTGKQDS